MSATHLDASAETTTLSAVASDPTSTNERLERRLAARRTLGLDRDQQAPPLRPVLREHGLTIYPMVALGLLSIVDNFQADAFTILTPEISRTLGISLGAIAAARTLAFLAIALAPLPMAALSQRAGSRALLCIVTGIAWSVVTLYTGFVTSLIALIVVLVLDGLSTGSVAAIHGPLLVDSYPPAARVRALSVYSAFKTFGQLLSPLLIAFLAGPLDLSWRGVFLGLGIVSLATTLLTLRLRDPGTGKYDTEALRDSLGEGHHAPDSATELRFFEIVRRVMLVPTVQRLSTGYFALGVLLIPFATYQTAFLEQRWDLDAAERGLFYAGIAAISIVGLVLFAKRAEARFREEPAWVLRFTSTALIAAVALIALGALLPAFFLMFACFALSGALLAIITPGFTAALLSVLDAKHRPHAAAMSGIFLAGGSIVGVLFLSGLDQRLGLQGAMVGLMLPGVVAGLIVRSAAKLVDPDLDRMVDEILETEDISAVRRSGGHIPMLQCKGVNFSYGQLQVLFDVDFTVDEGEMVALLGTNGAGKSTLLKVVSGLGLPSAGTVRFRGNDVTYLDAERRVPLGISQVPGGKAVFGTLDVIENLRTYGYTVSKDRKRVGQAIELCLDTFPRLQERRTSLAATLSGGEQQMLALSKALILQPRLLLIDELSLGLAPVIVGQLLDLVREINAGGTAVVLVEQSVNIALSLVDHAYFMEKGQMRFDGPAQQLLERDDLLRAVFLEGADKADQA